jgi:transcriptional regulator with XRE-family HTH domain
MNHLGEKIRHIRNERKYSQEYMSFRLNVSQRTYSRIENGETKLSWERIGSICAVLEIDPLTLTGDYTLMLPGKTSTNPPDKAVLLQEITFLKEKVNELLKQNSRLIALIEHLT